MTSDNRVEVTWAFDDATQAVSDVKVESLVRLVLDSENISWKSIGVVFGSHRLVRDLNKNYLQHDFNTDVLSFLIDESTEGIEGEVYIDVETALERYEEFGATLENELVRYVAHGVLHLAGYNDAVVDGKDAMRVLEDKYLAALDF
ncbi:MAG: rRNA maturation RNase YbeY [Bacteroidetes bacterium]|nr:MAG: rRNA maturation RNase YbeY [Bacteroidota bacterium]